MANPESEAYPAHVSVTPDKRERERFEIVPTPIEGVSFAVEPGQELDITKKDARAFYSLACEFAKVKGEMDQLDSEQEPRREELIKFAQEYNLRGLDSLTDNLRVRIYPARKVTLDRKLTQEALGVAYYAKVKEELALKIPLGGMTKEGVVLTRERILGILKNGLDKMGISEFEQMSLLRDQVALTTDEETLEELKRVLPPEAIQVEPIWQVRVNPLRKIP